MPSASMPDFARKARLPRLLPKPYSSECAHGLCNAHRSARTDLRMHSAPTVTAADAMIDCLAGHQEGGSGQTDQDHFESSESTTLEARYQRPQLDARLCRQSLRHRLPLPDKKRGALRKKPSPELTRTAGSAPPGSPGFHVRLQRPLRQQPGRTGHSMMKVQQKISGLSARSGGQSLLPHPQLHPTARKNVMSALDAIARVFTVLRAEPQHLVAPSAAHHTALKSPTAHIIPAPSIPVHPANPVRNAYLSSYGKRS